MTKHELAEMPLDDDIAPDVKTDSVPRPASLIPPLRQAAVLLDIDGTLLDFAPTPREVWVPPELSTTLRELHERTHGALALVSGRSLNDIDLIFAPEVFSAIGGHGAEMRLQPDSEAVAAHAPPLDKELKRRLAAIAKLSPGILLEDKGYSLALHYRLAPQAERAIYEAVSLIRAELPNAPIEVLPGKSVCEIKHSGFTKATGVLELMTHEPFKGRRPFFIGDDVTDETVFAIMPDFDGLAFSVGRRATGVAGHFDGPSDVREFLAHLLDVDRDVSLS
ncbi:MULTISPECIES: trehalose-phosphatase [Bradyrhizobium]|jgi:trehalose 6-phosphate phosphatase|uniref:Trehalose 6-phosphate phosphatase n=1 Tax=Bradyrhizobium elkanii TaxID=29448 RepID=A0A1E3EKG9_BRAEL|nr:trehalose 6-phosphate phosphatase [Bradyrhizobium elkanii]MCS4009147.1 trehalose 6-phosphate phosphatase [Bradyrhizobium elkanii USDA 61]MCP1927529.1 trehalose 6-phosphate phosphatase [Bradyrhizobium elkanii]MCS3474954.1 trehalose 6-phosphate phosphatase [Bradyrhizobium elkanii]MCS3520955.1 trehalose 6-phosphate phosphatase [Bradyrhizobium elkanii]